MIVEFAGGITAASGTLCKNRNGSRVIVTTRRAPSANKGKIRMYIRPPYQRRTPVSDAEIAAQQLFTKRQAYVRELIAEAKENGLNDLSREYAWKIAKQNIK